MLLKGNLQWIVISWEKLLNANNFHCRAASGIKMHNWNNSGRERGWRQLGRRQKPAKARLIKFHPHPTLYFHSTMTNENNSAFYADFVCSPFFLALEKKDVVICVCTLSHFSAAIIFALSFPFSVGVPGIKMCKEGRDFFLGKQRGERKCHLRAFFL